MNNLIYRNKVRAAFSTSDSSQVTILNQEEKNVISNNHTYTIPYEDIKAIIELTKNNDLLFKDELVECPPIMDGSETTIFISDLNRSKEIYAPNLWYFEENEPEKEYTKNLVNYIKEVNKVLNKNNIK